MKRYGRTIEEYTAAPIHSVVKATVNYHLLNIRSAPVKEEGNVIEVVKKDDILDVVEEDIGSTWVRVSTPSGNNGYAMSEFLTF